jgi:hypothetical protein
MTELILKDDMGSNNYLKITREDDGDIIVSVISSNDRLSSAPEVQFCTSGTVNYGLASFFNKLLNKFSVQKGKDYKKWEKNAN